MSLCLTAQAADLQRLIDEAPAGGVLRIPAGTYAAPIKIGKPLTLIGEGMPVIHGGGAGDIVTIAAADCVVRGFVIRSSGDSLDAENVGVRVVSPRAVIESNVFQDVLFGIDLKHSPGSVLRANRIISKQLDVARQGDPIRLWRSDDCIIDENVIEHGRDALLWYSNRVTVRRNISRHNRYGFHMMYANQITMEDNELSENSVGIYLMYGKEFTLRGNRISRNRGPSGYGIGLKEVDTYSITDNVLIGNRVGIYIDGSPYSRRSTASVTNNTFACNDVGMAMLPAVKGNRIWNNNFIDNIEQIAVLGRGELSGNTFAVDGRGNYWNDYAGYDADRDGVGDFKYQSRKLFESLIDREPKLRLLLFSPAHEAVEFIARAMPAVQPQPKFADSRPLMQPVNQHAAAATQDDRLPMLAVAATLLGVATLIWSWTLECRLKFAPIGGTA